VLKVTSVRDTIVIGGSAGGIDAVSRVIAQLPPDLPATVLVALHIAPNQDSVLPEIFARHGKLPALAPSPGRAEPLKKGRLYVVRPDYHLAVVDGEARAVRGPRVNGRRPAIDVLFRSSARVRGHSVIGVVLTGMLDDGVGGLREIRSSGGVALVQDPREAAYPDLPSNAISGAGADHIVELDEMGPLLLRLLGVPVPDGPPKTGRDAGSERRSMPDPRRGPSQDWSSPSESPEAGSPSVYGCPECGGVLWNAGPSDLPRLVCRVGHAYDPESLLSQQITASDQAMWKALRALEEQASLARKLELRARSIGDQRAQGRFGEMAAAADRYSRLLRESLLHAANDLDSR